MRDKFISELLKEVLGPRDGSEETLLEDPYDEYLTGVIVPRRWQGKDVEAEDAETAIGGVVLRTTFPILTSFPHSLLRLIRSQNPDQWVSPFVWAGQILQWICALQGDDIILWKMRKMADGKEHQSVQQWG